MNGDMKFKTLQIVVLLIAIFLSGPGCVKDNETVLGKPSSDAISVTPSAAHIGINKFEGKVIKVKMGYKEEKPSADPLTRMLIFRGEEREFSVIAKKGEYDAVINGLKPGQIYTIYGVLEPPESEMYFRVILQ